MELRASLHVVMHINMGLSTQLDGLILCGSDPLLQLSFSLHSKNPSSFSHIQLPPLSRWRIFSYNFILLLLFIKVQLNLVITVCNLLWIYFNKLKMKVKKQKRHRKTVRFFTACFGFRQPYKVICDGTFVHHLIENRITPADQALSNTLAAPVKLFTTKSVFFFFLILFFF